MLNLKLMSNTKQYCFHFLEHKLQENVVDFDAAASGNEDELAKLIAIIMHLTMVQKPCENITERTMWKLSTEDHKVIEAILLDVVNDD
jgi:predicted house-cleaning noncanonical NTP pyrophosphatase (MazG superfamily)